MLGPALAMDNIPGPVCFKEKFSSANLEYESKLFNMCIHVTGFWKMSNVER